MQPYANNSALSHAFLTCSALMVPFICPIIRKEVFDKIGYIDEEFAKDDNYGYDDFDFCIRAHEAKYDVIWYTGIVVKHIGTATYKEILKHEGGVSKSLARNRQMLIKKWSHKYTEDELFTGKNIY
jgi:GT2 family glycosyltransferase